MGFTAYQQTEVGGTTLYFPDGNPQVGESI